MTTNNNKQAEKSELSELERLRAENRALRVENEYLKNSMPWFRSADIARKISNHPRIKAKNLNIHWMKYYLTLVLNVVHFTIKPNE